MFIPCALSLLSALCTFVAASSDGCGAPPEPEPIEVVKLPLPPVSAPTVGACNSDVNVHGTGCMDQTSQVYSGNFLPDNRHIVATINFTGAPAAPDPRSIYSGLNVVIIRVDNTTFPNGSPWKCITCGISAARLNGTSALDQYPQAFWDGRRILVGNNIVDGHADLTSPACTSNTTFVYPIRLKNQVNDSGPGLPLRELRIHPDNVHLGLNSLGGAGEDTYFSRLSFNPNPTTGVPLVPRYDLVNVTQFNNPHLPPFYYVTGNELRFNRSAISPGEFRGFTGSGKEILYIGNNYESDNVDMTAVCLSTGVTRRITRLPGYVDPIDVSHDDQWNVILDTRFSNRTDFVDGMRHVPPINDILTAGAVSSIRNNGIRRFFQPWLLDRCGDRGDYHGQQINAGGDYSPGSINDPNWNAWADPRWSFDGTKVVWHEAIVVSPACGGANPLSCPTSTEQGGRTWRVMMATFSSRHPKRFTPVKPVSDVVPWGLPYTPGSTVLPISAIKIGNYTLNGQKAGHASVQFIATTSTAIDQVTATYHNFSDDGCNFISGSESVSARSQGYTQNLDWFSNLTETGQSYSTKLTSPDGFHLSIDLLTNLFTANGTLTTTVNHVPYVQPQNLA